jgi:predicted dehydrogenase
MWKSWPFATWMPATCKMVYKPFRNAQARNATLIKTFANCLERKDIDAVVVATPDHWHGLISIAAARAGKDIYCEKPLVNSVVEGRALCKAVSENKRILQTGSHERSTPSVRFACELVRNGLIGKGAHRAHPPAVQRRPSSKGPFPDLNSPGRTGAGGIRLRFSGWAQPRKPHIRRYAHISGGVSFSPTVAEK